MFRLSVFMERKKITVKHYLNLRAKEKVFQKEKYFPLYIQIIVNGKKAQIKSRIHEFLKIYRSDIERITQNNADFYNLILDGYFSEKLMELIEKRKLFPLAQLLLDEISVLKRIIIHLRPFDNNQFTLFNFGWEYQVHTTEITKIFDNHIKNVFQVELKEIFLKTIDQDNNRELFKTANYFINYLNWNNSFSSLYEETMEIMQKQLKMLENLLSNELLISIRAYLAYLSKVNIVNRLFERRQEGRITTLSYLDWQTDIKQFVYKEFVPLFGEQKALEYQISLDNILQKAIKFQNPAQ
jgi:hypothetical protein